MCESRIFMPPSLGAIEFILIICTFRNKVFFCLLKNSLWFLYIGVNLDFKSVYLKFSAGNT